MEKITVKSATVGVSNVEDIIIREGDKTRLLLRPVLLDNETTPEACVKGAIIYQKKNDDGEYKEDDKAFGLINVKKGQYCKIELKSEEVMKILDEFNTLKEVYAKYGFNFGERTYYISDEDLEGVLTEVSKFEDKEKLIEVLKKIDKENIDKLSLAVSLSKIEKILEIWEANKTESREEFWQKIFQENSWILSQIFACPYLFVSGKVYAGGKSMENVGGSLPDFLMKQSNSRNIAFIEIKTPVSEIMNPSIYRGVEGESNSVYANNLELSGAVNQVLNQRRVFLREHAIREDDSREYENPRCVIIIGDKTTLNSGQIKCFDLFRGGYSKMEIITYDEIFERISLLKQAFSE